MNQRGEPLMPCSNKKARLLLKSGQAKIIKYNPFSSKAYYLNSYEMEAYANENNLEYSKSYTGEYLHVYKEVKDKGKIWKELGCSSRKWKEYVRTIRLE